MAGWYWLRSRCLYLALCRYREQDEPSTRIAGLQTLATEEGKQMVLSVTLSDGNNVKYLIELPQADKLQAAAKKRLS